MEKEKVADFLKGAFGNSNQKKAYRLAIETLYEPQNKDVITHLESSEINQISRALYLRDKFAKLKMKKSEAAINSFLDKFLVLRISYKRMSRDEFIRAFLADLNKANEEESSKKQNLVR